MGNDTTCPQRSFRLGSARVTSSWRWCWFFLGCLGPLSASAQIDPVQRNLLQVGYNMAMQGHPPLSGYAYYYRNKPNFLSESNLTLRLAIAPTYLDSEIGFSHLLGKNTDLGIGLAGGGFADTYQEIRRGKFEPHESFNGNSGEFSASVYHLFNPEQKIPLNGVVRGIAHYSFYDRNDDTRADFSLPDDRGNFIVRTGLRFGGREPTLFPSLAMELSVWYEGQFRTDNSPYGFLNGPANDPINGPRKVEPHSHLLWGAALLAYTLPRLNHNFYLSLTAGTSVDADRFSAYRLGALLPLVAEYPLSLPGYYYQELSARQFVLFGANYLVPLDQRQRWNINVMGATAAVDYLRGLEQPGHWHSGVGAGILYKTPSWKIMVGYAYGVDAIRSGGEGAHSVGLLMQLDLGKAKEEIFNPAEPSRWQGIQRVFGLFGS